jgi:hypothetical protein
MSQTLILPSPKQGAARPKHRIGHSRGLYVLCASIGAERFSFFLLTATLVLSLNERVGLSSAHSVEMVGYFLCATYLTPLWGGRLCDGRMGCRRVAALGCVLQTAGYCAFLIGNFAALLCGLILLAIGSGFFKASTQTLMGGLSADGDQQRERSFSALYMVINVSALTAPLLAGVLQQHTSWRGNYVVASLGTLLSGVSPLAWGSLAGHREASAARFDSSTFLCSSAAPTSTTGSGSPRWRCLYCRSGAKSQLPVALGPRPYRAARRQLRDSDLMVRCRTSSTGTVAVAAALTVVWSAAP